MLFSDKNIRNTAKQGEKNPVTFINILLEFQIFFTFL